jgi:hypothetical protein
MYLAQCTSCAVEQSFEWKPGDQCFDCGGSCQGAMICPDCLEPKRSDDLVALIKTNPKACPTCSSTYPQLNDWKRARLISKRYSGAKNISWDQKYSKLFVDHRETFTEWTESFASQIDQLKADFSHLDQLKPLFKTQFYRYGLTNKLLRGLPTDANTFVERYKNWFSKLDALTRENITEFVALSRYHAPLCWLGITVLLKLNVPSDGIYFFRVVFDKYYNFGTLAMAEAACLAANWRYRNLLGLDDAGKHGYGLGRSLLSEECLEDLLPLIDHPHFGDWVLLAICQWIKAHPSADKGDSDFIKNMRSSAPKLMTELNSRRKTPKTKMSETEFMDFKISAALLAEDVAFISTVTPPPEKNLNDVLTKFIVIRSDRSTLNIPVLRQQFSSLDETEQSEFLWRTIDANEDVIAKLNLSIEFLREAKGPIRDKLLYFIENISESQFIESARKETNAASAVILFDLFLAPDYQLNTVELLRIGAHANRLKNLPDCEIFKRKLLSRTMDVLRTEYPTPESLLSLMSSTDYQIKKWFTEAVIERACELGEFDTIGNLAISPGIRRHMAQMFRDFDSSFVEKTVPALMSFTSKITNDEDPETIKAMRETWIADLLRSNKKADVLSGLAGLYARSSIGRRPLIGLAGDRVFEIAGILEFQGLNFWEHPSQVISDAMTFDGFRLLNWTFMTLKQLPNHRFESFVAEMANLVTSRIPKEGSDVLDAYIRISEDLQSRASNLGPATSKRIADAISSDLSSLVKKLKSTGHWSPNESRDKETNKIISEILETCARLQADANQDPSHSEDKHADENSDTMKEQQAEIAAQVQASAHAALEIGNQMAVMAKYQADMTALMARTDLSPLERAETMQKLAAELQKKMS